MSFHTSIFNQQSTVPPGDSSEYEYIRFLDAPENLKNFAAKTEAVSKNKDGRKGKKWKREISPERQKRLDEAKQRLDELVWDLDLHPGIAAQMYIEENADVEAYPLRLSKDDANYQAWSKFNIDTKPAFRLFGCLSEPHLYSLHADHLYLPREYGDAEAWELGSYDLALRKRWLDTLKREIQQPYVYKFDNASRFHCHFITAKDAGLLHLPRGGEIVKPIEPGTEFKTLSYFYEPHAPCDELNLTMWIEAKRVFYPKYLPRTRDFKKLIGVAAWTA